MCFESERVEFEAPSNRLPSAWRPRALWTHIAAGHSVYCQAQSRFHVFVLILKMRVRIVIHKCCGEDLNYKALRCSWQSPGTGRVLTKQTAISSLSTVMMVRPLQPDFRCTLPSLILIALKPEPQNWLFNHKLTHVIFLIPKVDCKEVRTRIICYVFLVSPTKLSTQ